MSLRWSWLVLIVLLVVVVPTVTQDYIMPRLAQARPASPFQSFPPVEQVELNATATTEVHGIATHFGGPLGVFVGPGDKPRILHLSSQEVADWRVYLLPGSRVERIYVSGFEAHSLHVIKASGVPDDGKPAVIDLGNNLVSHETLSFGPPTSPDHRSFAAYRDEIAAVTGHPLTHFQGARFLRPGSAFAIGLAPADRERLAALFPRGRAEQAADDAAAELTDALADLEGLIVAHRLPAQLPDFLTAVRPHPGQLTHWSPIDAGRFEPAPRSQVDREKRCALVELGSTADDAFYCGMGYGDGSTRIVFAGGGADTISDRYYLSQVLSGGAGDDVIEADLGNDVIFVSADWGHDVVDFRCGVGEVEDFRGGRGWAGGDDTPEHQRSRFVVFGRGIDPRDLVWADGHHLTHPPSGSSIDFASGACAKLVAVEPGAVPPSPEARD